MRRTNQPQTHRGYCGRMTYSIVARNDDGRLGVGVQTCVMGVGAICSWARAGVGAVATQSISLRGYGPRLLDRLATGEPPQRALDELAAQDELREQRQVAVVGADGSVAAFTGGTTIPYAGDVQAEGVSCQANMMASPGVPEAMLDAFLGARGPLQRRLLTALRAAEAAGGDFRGRQSAAMLVVDASAGEESWQGVTVDVRIDDDPEPLTALARLLDVDEAYDLIRASTDAAKRGDVAAALGLSERALALAPHDQNVAASDAILRAHGGDLAGLQELIRRSPGTVRLVEWLRDRGEVQLDDAVMARLAPEAQRAR
jgi:uncharacterized Ntn-hydrolase superfamily protein